MRTTIVLVAGFFALMTFVPSVSAGPSADGLCLNHLIEENAPTPLVPVAAFPAEGGLLGVAYWVPTSAFYGNWLFSGVCELLQDLQGCQLTTIQIHPVVCQTLQDQVGNVIHHH